MVLENLVEVVDVILLLIPIRIQDVVQERVEKVAGGTLKVMWLHHQKLLVPTKKEEILGKQN